MRNMPRKLKVFRRVGADELHIGSEYETMSHGNADGAMYVLNDPQVMLEVLRKQINVKVET